MYDFLISRVSCLSDQNLAPRGFGLFRLLVLSSVLFVVLIKTIKPVYISTNYFLINRTRTAISAIRYVLFVKTDNLAFGKSIYSNCTLKSSRTFPLLFRIDLRPNLKF